MTRVTIPSESPWGHQAGYARAVRIGPHIWVAGTAGLDKQGHLAATDDAATQARRAFGIIQSALQKSGANMKDIVRTRLYLVDLGDWPAVAEVHRDLLRGVLPVSIMIVVSKFVDPNILLEIEVDAFIDTEPA